MASPDFAAIHAASFQRAFQGTREIGDDMNEAAKPAQNPIPGTGWAARYAKVDLSRITVRKASSDEDFALVGRLREAGFSRVANSEDIAWIDDADRSPGVFSLIAYNSLNEPVATMRVQDGRAARLEIARFIPLDSLLSPDQMPAIQGARLSVLKKLEATDAMLALFKSVWQWCVRENIRSILIASPPWARPAYDFLMFEDLGPLGHFAHRFLDDTPHISMRMPVDKPISVWPIVQHPLYAQYNRIFHPHLELA